MSKNLLKEDIAFLKEAKNKLESNIFLEQAAGLTMLIDQIAHMEGRLHNKAVESDFCSCRLSDPWRCAVDQGISEVICGCQCHKSRSL